MNFVGDSDFAEDSDINVVVKRILTIASQILILLLLKVVVEVEHKRIFSLVTKNFRVLTHYIMCLADTHSKAIYKIDQSTSVLMVMLSQSQNL